MSRRRTDPRHLELPKGYNPPSTSAFPPVNQAPPPPPAAPRTALTADERIRIAALHAAITLANGWTSNVDGVIAAADRYAAYIRDGRPKETS